MPPDPHSWILGVYTGHNATAALLRDGCVVGCVSEERFVGIKNAHGYPEHAIQWLLQSASVPSERLTCVALAGALGAPQHATRMDVRPPWFLRALELFAAPVWVVRRAYGELAYRWPVLRGFGDWCYRRAADLVGPLVTGHQLRATAQRLNIPIERVRVYEHHLCHAAYAAYASPYSAEDQLVLTLDGEGDKLCGTVNTYHQGQLARIAETPLGHSLGWIYMDVTRYLGMKPMEHEYKVMGLAPYAKGERVSQLYRRIQGLITLDPRNPLRQRARFDTHQTYRYLRQAMEGYRFDEVAGAFQRLTEECLMAWVREAVRITGCRTVALGGGVFMNVKANQRIAELPEVERVFAAPTCGDESNAIGTAYLAHRDLMGRPPQSVTQPLEHLYLGPEFDDETIQTALDAHGGQGTTVAWERCEDIEERTAEILAHGHVVARVAGRMEWGARALGNRSILAHPSDPDTVRVINEFIKNRDFWMPFAPSMLRERADDYLANPKRIPAPFMAMTFTTTARGRRELRAAMHPYDFTIRPQLVDERLNPAYWRLICAFERRTGIGAVLNTSFNLHGFPIVLGPKEALAAFDASGLEYLTLGPYLVRKLTAPDAAAANAHRTNRVAEDVAP